MNVHFKTTDFTVLFSEAVLRSIDIYLNIFLPFFIAHDYTQCKILHI